MLRHFAPQIARTKSLFIMGNRTEVRAVSLLFCTPSPSSQYLTIYSYRGFVHLPDFLGQQVPLLRSLTFDGIHPGFESHLPLSSLIEFNLSLLKGAIPLRVGALFRFLSNCSSLRNVRIESKEMAQETTLDRVISLGSLVELNHTWSSVGRIVPFLRLPRFKRLLVS